MRRLVPAPAPEAPAAARHRSLPSAPPRPAVPLTLSAPLGAGGSATVLLAHDGAGRAWAVKRLLPALAARRGAAALLAREAAVLARVRHPHIVECAGIVEVEGQPALLLEYLGGGDLVSLAGAAPGFWLPAARAVLGALAHCHAAGIAHGDVKARNVLFDTHDRARLADFSTALPLTADAARALGGAGVPPAAAAAIHADARAFGALLFELLCGMPPVPGSDPTPALEAAAAAGTVPARLSAAIRDVLLDPASARLSMFADVIEFALVKRF